MGYAIFLNRGSKCLEENLLSVADIEVFTLECLNLFYQLRLTA